MLQIEVNTFEDVQKLQETYHIPFTASITRTVKETINALALEGQEEISLELAVSVLPASYSRVPKMWQQRCFTKGIRFPFLQIYRRGSTVFIDANNKEAIQPNFKKQLLATLQNQKVVNLSLDKIPSSYQQQPANLAFKLKKLGFKNARCQVIENQIRISHEGTTA